MFGFKDRNRDARKKSDDDTTQVLVAPGTEISYKAALIDKYKQDHQNLHSLFSETLSALQQADAASLQKSLRELQVALRKHLLDEELNLYIYLRHCYGHDRLKQELITKFKKRSKKVGMETFEFIRKVADNSFQIGTEEPFLSDLLGVGNMLETLMEAVERHLYPIYKRP